MRRKREHAGRTEVTLEGWEAERRGVLGRRKTIPPAPAWPWDEAGVLRDLDGALGLLLWQRARDVRLWARMDPTGRRALFRNLETLGTEGGGDVDLEQYDAGELAAPLAVLREMIRCPESAAGSAVAGACLAVSGWAERKGVLGTAASLAEAAAAAPSSAGAALAAARTCRRAGATERATIWYLRAIPLAWRVRDHDTYVRAQLGYGFVLFTAGDIEAARSHYRRAARVARWVGSYGIAAEAHHDLLTIASDAGTHEEGERYARAAMELYSVRAARLPYLVHDYAFLLIRNGYFAHAVRLLGPVLDRIILPRERILVVGNLARCVGALGERARFEALAEEALRLSETAEEFAAAALLNVAEGARALLEWELAGEIVEVATRRGHATPRQRAAALLDQIAGRKPGDAVREPTGPARIRELTASLLSRLAKSAAASRG